MPSLFLPQAAVYGRAFCSAEAIGRTALKDLATSLRLLNALRAPSIGMPLTLRQLEDMTAPVLLQRLVAMHHHLLALRAAAALGLRPDAVRSLLGPACLASCLSTTSQAAYT